MESRQFSRFFTPSCFRKARRGSGIDSDPDVLLVEALGQFLDGDRLPLGISFGGGIIGTTSYLMAPLSIIGDIDFWLAAMFGWFSPHVHAVFQAVLHALL